MHAALHVVETEILFSPGRFNDLVPIPVAAPGAGGLVHQGLDDHDFALDLTVLGTACAVEGVAHDIGPLGQGRGAVFLPELIPGVEGGIRDLMAVIVLDGDIVGVVQAENVAGLYL